jgi:hypothetical protein
MTPLKIAGYCAGIWLNLLFGRADKTVYVSKTRPEDWR